jgi:phosphoribosylformylglycinamidine synthase
MGGSALAQVYAQTGDTPPDVEPEPLKGFFAAIQRLGRDGRILAYHDRSDGGLFVTACEMAFAGRAGLALRLDDAIPGGRSLLEFLFNEELGALLQVKRSDLAEVQEAFAGAGLEGRLHVLGAVDAGDSIRIAAGAQVFAERRRDLHRAWSETSWRLQALRDNPECARQEYDRLLDDADPGLSATLSFDPADDIAAPYVARGARPRVAILREQGINGQVEMAAAFHRAGFSAVDVHMTDIIAGRMGLEGFQGVAAGGGFSYGDVLGAGEGWAKSVLFNARARDQFDAFFRRADTFALGVCNGCQMMTSLRELVPGAEHWPRMVRNLSEQFEARFVMVEVQRSPSLFFEGMAGSRMPVAVAHGEGHTEFAGAAARRAVGPLVALRYVDNRGAATETYPGNPSGSPDGVTGLTTPDGRFTVLMPHPERVFRTVQNSWHPGGWGEDGPWMRMFRNARKWVG